jgi:hypothetical protein
VSEESTRKTKIGAVLRRASEAAERICGTEDADAGE